MKKEMGSKNEENEVIARYFEIKQKLSALHNKQYKDGAQMDVRAGNMKCSHCRKNLSFGLIMGYYML